MRGYLQNKRRHAPILIFKPLWRLLYNMLMKTVIFRGTLYSLENGIRAVYPQNKEELKASTARLFCEIAFVYILVTCAAIFAGVQPYIYAALVLVLYVVTSGWLKKRFFDAQTELLSKFERFVSELRYKYQLTGMLREAFLEALDNADHHIMLHGDLMLSCIDEQNGAGKGDDADYRDLAPNSFFYTLYSLCRTLLVYGDKKEEKKSLFMDNLGYLKEDIYAEILKRRKIKSRFSGLMLTSLLPILFIRPIEIWSEYNMPELKEYFKSSEGKVITILLIMLSLVTYRVLVTMKYPGERRAASGIWNSIASRRIIERIVLFYMKIRYKSCYKLNMRFNEMAYPYTVKEFIVKRWICSIITFIWAYIILTLAGICPWWAVPAAFAVFYGMYAGILIEERVIKLGREEEIVRFQNIILMLMGFERIDVIQILEQMELFATVFKRRIESMTDNYPYQGMKVFEDMHGECGYPPFERLMEGFMACDSVPVSTAFADIRSDRSYYMEKHKQDNDDIISNKSAVGRLIAYIPLYGVVILKLIIPFVAEGLKMINGTYI